MLIAWEMEATPLKLFCPRAEETAQWLRVILALPEDLSSAPSMYIKQPLITLPPFLVFGDKHTERHTHKLVLSKDK